MEGVGMTAMDFWQGKRVFLTGHTGFKGAWLCKILEMAGADVTGYALRPPTVPDLYNLCKPNVRSIIGDIRDFNVLFKAYQNAKPEIVIHMAAQPLVLESYREPRYTYETNVMGAINILECVRLTETARSVLNVTTDKVYFNQERNEGYREEETLDGFEPYANSKSCSELVTSSYIRSFFCQKNAASNQNRGASGRSVAAWAQNGVAVSTARSGNVIGGGDFADNRIIPDCARSAAKGESILIRNASAIRPYQHVLDTLFAYLLILRSQWDEPSCAGAYNIGPDEGDCLTNAELVSLFCEAWGGGAHWEHVPLENQPHEANFLKLDCTKIHRVLSWGPRWDTAQAVYQSVKWYKAFYNGGTPSEVMASQISEFAAGIKTAETHPAYATVR